MGFSWNDSAVRHPRVVSTLQQLRRHLPPRNFITIHYAYFIGVLVVSSLIFWGSSNPALSVSYTDSLFLVVSAMTEAGLNTVNLSQLTTWQQIILFLLIVFGGSIWVSIWTVAFRKHVFEQRFHSIVKAERARRLRRPAGTTGSGRSVTSMRLRLSKTLSGGGGLQAVPVLPDTLATSIAESTPPGALPELSLVSSPGIQLGDGLHSSSAPQGAHQGDEGDNFNTLRPTASGGHITFEDSTHPNASSSAYQPAESRPMPSRRLATATSLEDASGLNEADAKHDRFYGPWGIPLFLTNRTVGRNSQFYGLSREEREQLGGCEYRALKLLATVVPLYFVLWQLVGCLALGAWINNHMASVATGNGINPWWLGVFNGASAFNNSGMTLLDANMVPFQNAHYVLITMGLMILAGNTAYPVFLRLIFWCGLKILRRSSHDDQFSDTKETLEFILKYPRRVYTNLFPSRPTWWLLFMVVLLNCIDWVAFELLNFGNPDIEKIPVGSRILDGLFQAVAVRSGGFYVVPMPDVYIGLQVVYVIMMYISVYPVVITMRHSNVYEERSLGIYSDSPGRMTDLEDAGDMPQMTSGYQTRQRPRSGTSGELWFALRRTLLPWHGVGVAPPPIPGEGSESRISFISQQIHGQLAHDLWWLVLAVLIITIIETSHFRADPVSYSVFNVIFEVVSAYGCVGISIGVPFDSYSFSGGWHSASKLVLCVVMIRGRHRGLPVALDRAVRLPGEQLHRDEEEDYRIRRSMTNRRVSLDGDMQQ